ncbi:hypothetical protein MNBD_GAMMA12-3278 [hydrothermal vent metagenome]|uniref:Uncharacterized protein n=1 Tax=hydrothermal vent metagenome TaxID=652676 RepID=A0A3B0YHQ6_9ZZZZ
MKNRDEVIVPLSRFKLFLLLIVVAIFTAASIWVLSLDPERIKSSPKFNNLQFIYGIAYVCISLCSLIGVYVVKKMFDSKPGLIINSEGITDNSSGVAAGLIPWSEIIGYKEHEIHSTKFLVIQVREPEKYAARGSIIQRALNKGTMKMVGSPISIASTSLRIKHTKLLELVLSYAKKYG